MGCLLKGNSGLYSRMTVGAVLLAAGAGSRLGGRPKALLELGGVPLVLRQLVALSGAGVDEVVVVLGHHADAIEAAVQRVPDHAGAQPDARRRPGVVGAHRPAGAVAAARCGDRRAGRPAADRRAGHRRADRRLQEARRRGDGGAARAPSKAASAARQPGDLRRRAARRVAGRRGRRWRAAAGAQAHPERVRWFDTDNRRYRLDIDTPEDLERFAPATGHALRWPAALARETIA